MTLLGSYLNRMLFVIVLSGLLAALLYVYFVQPLKTELGATEAEVARKQSDYERLRQHSGAAAEAVSKDSFDLAVARRAVPEAPYADQLLMELRMLEVVSGASMNGYQFDAADRIDGAGGAAPGTALGSANAGGLRPVYITTSMEGTYSQIVRLLEELRTAERLIVVETLGMSVQDPDESLIKLNVEDPQVVCNVRLVSYYAPELAAFVRKPLPGMPSTAGGRNSLLYGQ